MSIHHIGVGWNWDKKVSKFLADQLLELQFEKKQDGTILPSNTSDWQCIPSPRRVRPTTRNRISVSRHPRRIPSGRTFRRQPWQLPHKAPATSQSIVHRPSEFTS